MKWDQKGLSGGGHLGCQLGEITDSRDLVEEFKIKFNFINFARPGTIYLKFKSIVPGQTYQGCPTELLVPFERLFRLHLNLYIYVKNIKNLLELQNSPFNKPIGN